MVIYYNHSKGTRKGEKNMIKVKAWMADQIRNEIAKYHWMPVFEYWTDSNGIEQAHNMDDDSYTFVGAVVQESEKSYKVELEVETEGFRGVAKPFTRWIPKSQVLAIA